MSMFDEQPRQRAGFRVRELVREVATLVFAAGELEEPVGGVPGLTRPVIDDPLAGVRAARLVCDVAAGALREWALRARGAGSDWDDVAAALDLTDPGVADEDPEGRSPGEVAWEWLVEHRPPAPARSLAGRPASAVWTCTTCRARVRDTGPYQPHPDDREQGHEPDCARHAAAVAAWRRAHDRDDDRDDDGED